MNTDITTRVTTKLFAGFLLNSELRMHLNQSKTYKQDKIGSNEDLKEIHYQDKDYFGIYLDKNLIHLPELKSVEATLTKKLEFYCPSFNNEHTTFFVLPQVFIK